MSNLLCNEFVKLRKSRTVKVVFFLMMVYSGFIAVFPGAEDSIQGAGFSAPFMLLISYGSLGFWANAAIVSEQIAGEFGAGTIHNILICGTERRQYFAAKVVSLYGVAAAIYLICCLFLCLCQNLVFEFDPEGMIFSHYWAKVLVYQLGALLVIFSWLSLSIFFSYLLRSAVASFVALVAANFVEVVLCTKILYHRNVLLGGPSNTVWVMQRMIANDSDRILSMDFLVALIPCILLIAASICGAHYLFQKADIN